MLAEKHKLKYLEGIRGLAAIIVVLHHFSLAFYPALNFGNLNQIHFSDGNLEMWIARSPLNILYNGGFAVSIFFILSGFVLSNTYNQTHNFKVVIQYAIKRYFRLLVPVGVSIIVAFIFMKMNFMHNTNLGTITKTNDWLSGAFTNQEGYFAVVKNIFIDVFFFKDNSFNAVLWTMTYELLGSFLLFVFLLIIHSLKYKVSLYIALVLLLLYTNNNFYAAFILGALLNKYMFQKQSSNMPLLIPNWVLVVFLIISIFFCSYPFCNDIEHTPYKFITFSFLKNDEFYHVIGAFILMFVILHSLWIKTFLSKNVFTFIGKISFSFYLLHFIILCSFSCYLFSLFYPFCNYNIAVLLSFLCSLPVIAVCSIVYDKWVDKSGIKLSEIVLSFVTSKIARLKN